MTIQSPPGGHPLIYPWLQQPAPAGPTDNPGLRPGPRFSAWFGHSHVFRPQPSPGMDAFAYEALGLTEFSPIGAGTHNRQQLLPLSQGTLFARRALPVQGLGGLVTGQVISQPLIVATDLQSEPLGEPPDPAIDWTGANWIGG